MGDIGGHRDLKTINCRNLIKGAMQGPLGDIGRHEDLDLIQKTNV